MDKIKDILKILEDIPKVLKDVPKVLLNLIEALPLLVKALVYLVTTLPKQLGDFFKQISNFISKATPLYAAIIVIFFAIFFGIQFVIQSVTGLSGAFPPVPLAFITFFIIYQLVLYNSSQLKPVQTTVINSKTLFDTFIKRSTPVIIPIILLFVALYIGLKHLQKIVTGFSNIIPDRILLLIITYIVYNIVMIDNVYLKLLQQYVDKSSNEFNKFKTKSTPIIIPIILLFITLFFSIRYLIKYLTGIDNLIPIRIFIFIISCIVYKIVMTDNQYLKLAKEYLDNFKNDINKYAKKASSVIVSIILVFIVLFMGIKYLVKYLTDSDDIVPFKILVLLVLYIMYFIIKLDTVYLQLIQKYILLGLIFLFNNPLIKDVINFNVKIDEKNPYNSIDNIIKWGFKNLLTVIFTLLLYAIFLKIYIKQFLSYFPIFNIII